MRRKAVEEHLLHLPCPGCGGPRDHVEDTAPCAAYRRKAVRAAMDKLKRLRDADDRRHYRETMVD